MATNRLIVIDSMPAINKLWNDRYRLEFFCEMTNKKEDWKEDNLASFLPAFGNLVDADFTGQGWDEFDGAIYPDMRLVEAGSPYVSSSGEHLVDLIYETLTATFVQEKDDDTDYELNGLRRVVRPLVAVAGTDYQKVVGTTTISHQVDTETAVTLYLSDYEIDDTDAYRRVTETWMERGILSKDESQGPSSIPNSKQHVWESFGEEPVSMPGIITGKLKSDILGFITYRYTSISNLNDGDPTSGTLSTYEENIDVRKPGFVEIKSLVPAAAALLGSSGSVIYIKTTPPTVGKLTATVTIEITTSSSADTPVAYNLEDVAVSATIMSTRITPLGETDGGTPISTASISVDQQALHHYTKGGSDNIAVTGSSSFTTGGVEIGGQSQRNENNKEITLEGTASVATTGIYDSNVVPIFIGLDETQYFRKTNYTLS